MSSFISSIGIISALTLATNLLGFGREVLFARAFGVGHEADAYVTAFSITAVCFLVFSAGSLQGAFMPRYQQAIVCGEPALARGLWHSTLRVLCTVLVLIVAALVLGAELWVAWVVPGFDEAAREHTAEVLRWLAPMVLLFGLGSLLQSVAHAHQRFVLPALVPLLNNVVIIASLLLLVPSLGLIGLSQGTALGALLWLILLPDVLRRLPVAPARLRPGELRGLGSAMLPLVVLLAADQFSALVQKTLVSDLETGSIAVLNYAARLEGLPVGIFAAAIAAVFFPALVEALARGNRTATQERFELGLTAVCFFAVPATLLLTMEPQLVVRVLLERGAFGQEASVRAAEALRWYALGLLPQSLIVFINRFYFAAGDTRTPMRIGVAAAALHVLFCWALVEQVGYLGIAIGTTVYALVYAALLLAGLGRQLTEPARVLGRASWRALAAGAVMAAVFWFGAFPESLLGLLSALTAGGMIYLLAAYLLGDPILRVRRAATTPALGGTKVALHAPPDQGEEPHITRATTDN